MGATTRLITLLACVSLALLLAACGAAPSTIADLPVYPGAVELKPGESAIGDTLQGNMEQDAAMREAMGVGGSTEQRGFSLTAPFSGPKTTAMASLDSSAASAERVSVCAGGRTSRSVSWTRRSWPGRS